MEALQVDSLQPIKRKRAEIDKSRNPCCCCQFGTSAESLVAHNLQVGIRRAPQTRNGCVRQLPFCLHR